MKSIKNAILVLFGVLLIAVLANILLSVFGLFFNMDVLHLGAYQKESTALIKTIFIVKVIALGLFIYGVFVLVSNLKLVFKGVYFRSDIISCFKRVGSVFCVSGIIGFLASITPMVVMIFTGEFIDHILINIDSKSLYIMLMILGLFFILFSKVLDKGSEIQQENNLTI